MCLVAVVEPANVKDLSGDFCQHSRAIPSWPVEISIHLAGEQGEAVGQFLLGVYSTSWRCCLRSGVATPEVPLARIEGYNAVTRLHTFRPYFYVARSTVLRMRAWDEPAYLARRS